MEDETATAVTETNLNGSHADGSGEGHVATERSPSRPEVCYMTDEEADRAAEEVFLHHRRLLAELAK